MRLVGLVVSAKRRYSQTLKSKIKSPFSRSRKKPQRPKLINGYLNTRQPARLMPFPSKKKGYTKKRYCKQGIMVAGRSKMPGAE